MFFGRELGNTHKKPGVESFGPIFYDRPEDDNGRLKMKGLRSTEKNNISNTQRAQLVESENEGARISYLHRTVKDYLEQSVVWKNLVQTTQHSGFDPYVALLSAYVIELKTTELIFKSKTVYNTGLMILSHCSRLEPVAFEAHIELLEELDRVVSTHWAGHDPESPNGHWSNCHPTWEHDLREARRVWRGDVLTMAIKSPLPVYWYINAKLTSTASSAVNTRLGLPLLAFALRFDEWGLSGKAPVPSRSTVQILPGSWSKSK